MRLPFLQMESDLLAHGGPEVANLAGCSLPAAVGHIALLRAWAVSMAGDDAPPDGWIAGDSAGRRIEAAAQWQGERGRLLEALCDAGQVATEDGGIRVLHLGPYAEAWERNLRSKERMRSLRERSHNNGERLCTEAARSAKFGGQTQTQKAEDLFPSVAVAPKTPRKKPAKAERMTDPRHAPLVKALVDACAEVTGTPYGFRGGQDARLVGDLLSLADQLPGCAGELAGLEVVRRWRIGLAWRWGSGEAPVQSLGALVQRWNECRSPETAPSRPMGGRGPAPPSDFETPTPYVRPAWLDPDFGKE